MTEKEYEFVFCIFGASYEQAQNLMDLIISNAEEVGYQVGGGFHEYVEERENNGEQE